MSSQWEPYLAVFKRRTEPIGDSGMGPAPPRVILPYVALAFAPGGVLAGFLIGTLAIASRIGPVFYTFLFAASVGTMGCEVITVILAIAALIECRSKGVPRGASQRTYAWAALVFGAAILLVGGLIAIAAVYIAVQVMLG